MKNYTHVVLYKKRHEDPWTRSGAMPFQEACYVAMNLYISFKIIEVRQEDNDG